MRPLICLAAFAGLGLARSVPAEETFGAFPVPPAAKSFRVGAMQVTVLHDGRFVAPNDGTVFGVDAGPGAVSDVLRDAGAPTDRLSLSVNVLLVRTQGRTLILDSGLGPKGHGVLPLSLKEAGVSQNAVTDVLITHSHGDHIGGLLDAGGHLAFPKATVRMATAEWEWLKHNGPAELVKGIEGHVRTFEPGAQIAPGVRSVALDGHTPGHVGYEIVSGKSRLLDIGDMAHSSIVSLAKPQWTVSFDNDAAAAKATRSSTLARLATDQELVFAPHFPFPGVGHVVAQGEGFGWKPGAPPP